MANPSIALTLISSLLLFLTNQQGLFAEPTLSVRKPWIAQSTGTRQWLRNHYDQNTRFANLGRADLAFVGDSLTEFWSTTGKEIWETEFSRKDIRAANAGVSADRTENILWRLMKGKATTLKPKGYIVMAGTNNLAMRQRPDPPADVARGIEGIVITLQRATPTAKILVLSITPNGNNPNLARQIQKTNVLLKEMAEKTANVEYLDLWPAFSDGKDRLKPALTADGTHFSKAGYERLANEIRPIWSEW